MMRGLHEVMDYVPGIAYRLISLFILPKFKEIPVDVAKVKSLLNSEAFSPPFLPSCSSVWALKASEGRGQLLARVPASHSVLKAGIVRQ